MDLFNRFRETILVNESDRTLRQLEKLKKLRDQMAITSTIDKDIRLLEAGLQGEKNILFELKNANIGMYVLQDITFRYHDLTAQVDFIVVTKAHVYLIECKNMIGTVSVNRDEFKRRYTINGKEVIEAIYSPLSQARRHKEVMKKIWLEKNSKLTALLYEKNFDRCYKPLVVLANPKSLLNLKYASADVKKNTIRADQLIEYIKNDIKQFDKSLYLSKKNMDEIVDSILKQNTNGNDYFVKKYENLVIQKSDADQSEKKNVVEEVKKSIEYELKTFRKIKAAQMKLPAYYIFTNEELNMILDKMPKTLDELRDANILSSIKFKCHGKEIVDIINKTDALEK